MKHFKQRRGPKDDNEVRRQRGGGLRLQTNGGRSSIAIPTLPISPTTPTAPPPGSGGGAPVVVNIGGCYPRPSIPMTRSISSGFSTAELTSPVLAFPAASSRRGVSELGGFPAYAASALPRPPFSMSTTPSSSSLAAAAAAVTSSFATARSIGSGRGRTTTGGSSYTATPGATFAFVPLRTPPPLPLQLPPPPTSTNTFRRSVIASTRREKRSVYSLLDNNSSRFNRYSRTFGAIGGDPTSRSGGGGSIGATSMHHHSLKMSTRPRRLIDLPESGSQTELLDADMSAERLNLYIDRQQDAKFSGDVRILEQLEQEGVAAFRPPEPKTARERWKQRFKMVLPHVGLVLISAAYTLLGAAIFHYFETPNETQIRNATAQRVQLLKDRIIRRLWALAKQPSNDGGGGSEPLNLTVTTFDEWSAIANNGMNAVIRDVFFDYTRNYMTPEDIIYGTGPTKWSFGSSVFFSWTAITTIGYGHIVPLTLEGRISCLLYALFGIPLILVTIADLGRFLSGGIIWVHNLLLRVRKKLARRCRHFFRSVCCRTCRMFSGGKRAPKSTNSSAAPMVDCNNNSCKGDAPESSVAASDTPKTKKNGRGMLMNHLFPGGGSKRATRRRRRKQRHGGGVGNTSEKRLFGGGMAQDSISDAGTFEDISEIQTQEDTNNNNNNDRTPSCSEDTHARADHLQSDEEDEDGEDTDEDEDADDESLDEDDDDGERDPYEPMHSERRVSVLFILVVMLGYTAGGACLMQLWERWKFVDAFYFCFVTVTTIGFGDIVPQNVDFLPATLCYIVVGLIITTMCIDLVGTEYIHDIHVYGRTLGKSFLTIGGKVVHLSEVFSYVAFLQKSYGLTPDQLDKLAQLPEEYLLDCMINGRQPDLNWIGGRPFIPPDIYYFKWIEQPRTLSFTSERVLASVDSELDLNTSRCSTARTLTPREYYQRILVHYCKQMQQQHQAAVLNAAMSSAAPTAGLVGASPSNVAATGASATLLGAHTNNNGVAGGGTFSTGGRDAVVRNNALLTKEALRMMNAKNQNHLPAVR